MDASDNSFNTAHTSATTESEHKHHHKHRPSYVSGTPTAADLSALLRKADAETDLEEAQEQAGEFGIVHPLDDANVLRGTHAQRGLIRFVHKHHPHTPSRVHQPKEVSPVLPDSVTRKSDEKNVAAAAGVGMKKTISNIGNLVLAAKLEADADKLSGQFGQMKSGIDIHHAPTSDGNADGMFDNMSEDEEEHGHFSLLKKREGIQRRMSDFDTNSNDSFSFYEQHFNMYGETVDESSYNVFDLDAQEEWATSWLAVNYVKLARFCLYISEHAWFDNYMLWCIALAGLVVGMDTYPALKHHRALGIADTYVLCSFAFEVLVRTIGEGLTPWRFFTNSSWRWNTFDFCIVFFSIPLIPFASRNLKLLRVMRLLRLTHVFKRIPQLNMIMRGLVDSLAFVSYIVLLWFMILYMYAIIGQDIFAKNDPWHFRSLEYAVITLLQVTVMDGWGQIFDVNYHGCEDYNGGFYTMDPELGGNKVGDLMICDPVPQPVVTSIYFISYVTLTAFCIIPLFIGAVSISMTDCVADMENEKKSEDRRLCLERLHTVDEIMKNPRLMTRKKKRAMELVGLAFRGEPISELNVARDSSVRYRLHAKYRELGALCAFFIERPRVQRLITLAIVTGGVVVGLQTDHAFDSAHHDTLIMLNRLILYVFTAEVVLKMVAEVEYPYMYFGDNWNIFDFVVVAGSYMPQAGSSVILLRLMRLMRVLKLMRQFPHLQVIIDGATDGLSAAFYISVIIGIIYYFFAVLANVLFADNDPASWGELHIGIIILFQIATQDNWTPYFYTIIFGCEAQPSPTMFDQDLQCQHNNPQFFLGTIYFTVFTIFGSYVLLALFVGSIGNAMDAAHDRQKSINRVKKRVKILKDALGLTTAEIEGYREAFDFIDVSGTGRIGAEELKFGLKYADKEMTADQFIECWHKMDRDGTDDIDFSEFLIFMVDVRTLAMERASASDPDQVLKVSGFADFVDPEFEPSSSLKSSKFVGWNVVQLVKNAGVAIKKTLINWLPHQTRSTEQEFELLGPETTQQVESDMRRITSAYENIMREEQIELCNLNSESDGCDGSDICDDNDEKVSAGKLRRQMSDCIKEATSDLLAEAAHSPRHITADSSDSTFSFIERNPASDAASVEATALTPPVVIRKEMASDSLSLELRSPSSNMSPTAEIGSSRSLLVSPARLCVNRLSASIGCDALLAAVIVVQRGWKAYLSRVAFLKVSEQMQQLANLCPNEQKMRRRDSLYRPYKGLYLPEDSLLAEQIRGGITRVVEFYSAQEEIVFVDCDSGQIMRCVDKVSNETQNQDRSTGCTIEQRITVLTDKAIYLLSFSQPNYHTREGKPKPLPLLLLQRRIDLDCIKGLQRVHISHLADCVLGLAVLPNVYKTPEKAEKDSRESFEDSTAVKRCPISGKEFNMVTIRRHCRVSGLVFCADACSYRQPLPDIGFEKEHRVGDPFIGLSSIQQREDVLLVCKRKSELLCRLSVHYQALNSKELTIIIGNRMRMRPGVYEMLVRIPAKEVSFLGGLDLNEMSGIRGKKASFENVDSAELYKMTTYSSTFELNLVCNTMSDMLRIYSENGLGADTVAKLDALRLRCYSSMLRKLRPQQQAPSSPKIVFNEVSSRISLSDNDDACLDSYRVNPLIDEMGRAMEEEKETTMGLEPSVGRQTIPDEGGSGKKLPVLHFYPELSTDLPKDVVSHPQQPALSDGSTI